MLAELPRELFLLILEFLEEIHPRSVTALACVNKHYYSVLAPILLQTLKVSVYDSEQLEIDVQQYSQLLQRVDGYGYVRRLIITVNNTHVPFESRKLEDHAQQQQQKWLRPSMSTVEHKGHDEEIFENYLDNLPRRDKDQIPLNAVYQTNHLWRPLADLMNRVVALESVFFHSRGQFPPVLLDCLHQHHSQCKLYIFGFNLWSVDAQGTDDYEFRLLSSPCLHGIATRFKDLHDDESQNHDFYLFEALRCLTAGLAPNVKKLHMKTEYGTLLRTRESWSGFAQQRLNRGNKQSSRGSLDYLAPCIFSSPYSRESLEIWNNAIDFSALKVLRITTGLTMDVIEYLAEECRFPSLTSLQIWLNLDKYVYGSRRYEYQPAYCSAANIFLLSLPALSSLHISGWKRKMATDQIIKQHGSRLRRLTLVSSHGEVLGLEELHQLGESCPLLEELTIKVSRSRGDAHEVAKYKALGQLPRLRRLFLNLDASDITLLQHGDDDRDNDEDRENHVPYTRNDPTFNDFDQQYCMTDFRVSRYPRNGHIRDAFINAALDRSLACGIYEVISSSKSLNHGNSLIPLEFMEVKVTGAGVFTDRLGYRCEGLTSVCHYLGSQPCRISRMIGTDSDAQCQVEDNSRSRHKLLSRMPFRLEPWLEEIFRRVWPAKTGEWWQDCPSFPLAVSADAE